ncbi:MAG: tetratricopeptide repeat protein [Desulfobacterales bacterium]|nr:tetratricopeptide repeat protein [Desulfobacterales bacterium]
MISSDIIIFALAAFIPIVFFGSGLLLSSGRKERGVICAVIGILLSSFQVYLYYEQRKSPVFVNPTSYSITPKSNSHFLFKLTNNLDFPVFDIAIRIRIEKGDLTSENIDMRPVDRSKTTSDLGGVKIHHDLFGFSYTDKEGRSVAQYDVYDIDRKQTKTFEVKIDGSQTTKEVELSFAVVEFSEKPKEIVRRKSHFGFLDKGNALAKEKKYAEAIVNYEKAVSVDGKSPRVYLNWGNVLLEMGRVDDAIAKYNEAIALDPKYVSAYFNLGVVHLKTGKKSEAAAFFSKVLEIEPESEIAKTAKNTIDLIKQGGTS